MSSNATLTDALMVSGDARIQQILSQEGVIAKPAFACRLDGFVNDTFTEYTNPSVYRPASVCRAQLVSTLSDTASRRGNYHLGFTMYTAAGHDEPVEIQIGHRKVALARNPDPDNRVHLFLVPEKFAFRGGEPFRLTTGKTDGPCRIEQVVLLPKRPRPTEPKLEILSPHVDVRHANGKARAYITWITNRPASGQIRWGSGKTLSGTESVSGPLSNHEAVLEDLDLDKTYRFEIGMKDHLGRLEAAHTGAFKTDLSPPQSRARRGRIRLPLRRSGPGSNPWPISVGVPFPKGALGNPDQLRLSGKGHGEIPVQTRALTRWPDGSIQWALLDFQADGRSDCTVEYGSEISRSAPPDALETSESDRAITIHTGPLRVEFPRDRAVFPGIVSVHQADGTWRKLTPARPSPAVTLLAGDGTEYRSGKPDAVVLEESGPERVCVRVDLTHRSRGKQLFRSVFRVHLFRGSSAIRVFHTFENDRTDDTFTHIRGLSLRSDLNVGAGPQARIGRRKFSGLEAETVRLQQTHDNHYALAQGAGSSGGKQAGGDVDLSGENAGVALSVRDFWQHYPKGVEVDASGITVQICPPLDAEDYPRGGEMEDRLYYYLLDGQYKFKCGVAKTHEMWFHIRSGGSAPPDFGTTAQNPPLYSVSPSAFNKSRAITRLPSKDDPPYPPYEEWVEAARNAYAGDRKAYRAFGMLNYGDWFGERVYNWGNLEYDTPWCFLQEYLRGGHPDFYTYAEEAARHLCDVDTVHHDTGANAPGAQYLHCVGHVGNYYPDGYRETAIFSGRWSVSHTWVEGPFLYALLSGDARVLESVLKTSSLLVGEMLNDYDFTNCRNCGWHLIHLAAAYRATGRRVFLNAARIIVDRVLERQRPSGGWERLMVPGHCLCHPPRHMGNAGFMMGILSVGLKRFYEATGEKRVRDAIVNAADYLIRSMWVPETRSFHYTSCPESRAGGGADLRILKCVATAYRFTKADRFKEVLLAGIQTAIGRKPGGGRGGGKGIGSPMRGVLQVIAELPKSGT